MAAGKLDIGNGDHFDRFWPVEDALDG
jgi:hypothetical protein